MKKVAMLMTKNRGNPVKEKIVRISLFMLCIMSLSLAIADDNFSEGYLSPPEEKIQGLQDPLPDWDGQTGVSRFHFVGKKETLSSLLKNFKFSKAQIKDVEDHQIFPEDFSLVQNGAIRVTQYAKAGIELKIFDPEADLAFLVWRKGKNTGVRIVPSGLETKQVRFSGVVGKSLVKSLLQEVKDYVVVQRFLNAYGLDYEVDQLSQEGANFGLVVEEQFYGENFVKYGEVLWTTLEINGKAVERNYVKFLRGGAFLPEDPFQLDKPLYSPLPYIRVTSAFSNKRFHPFRRRKIPHRGVDLGIAKGTSVFAAQAGEVVRMGRSRSAGKYIVINHKNGFETSYEHLSEILPEVEVGTAVEAGQRIAQVGCTGFCTSPHLHFGAKKDGEYVNPVYFMKSFPYQHIETINSYVDRLSSSDSKH